MCVWNVDTLSGGEKMKDEEAAEEVDLEEWF